MYRIGTFTLSLLMIAGVSSAPAQTQPTTAPTTGRTSSARNWPTIVQIEQDVRALYQEMTHRTVRVLVPVQMSPNEFGEHPLVRWGARMDPRIRDTWIATAQNQPNAPRMFVEISRPMPSGAMQVATQPQRIVQGRVPLPPPIPTMNVEFIGLVLNNEGHVLVPLFIDRASVKGPMQVSTENGTTTASVVQSDRMTALTVLKLAQPFGKPVEFAEKNPETGSIVVVLAPTQRGASLDVWPGAQSESGIMVNSDGAVCGILRNRHALFPATFKPVVDRLRLGEEIKRAMLGVLIREIGKDDPLRTINPALGASPAARVEGVLDKSAAHKAGVQPGDVILTMDGHAVEDVATFAAAVANCGGKTVLQILRNGSPVTVNVELSASEVQ